MGKNKITYTEKSKDKRFKKKLSKQTIYKYNRYNDAKITDKDLEFFKQANLKKDDLKIFSFINKIETNDINLHQFKMRVALSFLNLKKDFTTYQLMKLFNCSEKSIANWNLFALNVLKYVS